MQMSRLRYDRLSYDTSGLLGPPGRWLLWFHGCFRSCPGCIAADWNNADAEYELSFQTLTHLLDTHPDAEGITISGGEPFGQSAFLADLTEHFHRHGLGIIVYTGFTLSELRNSQRPRGYERPRRRAGAGRHRRPHRRPLPGRAGRRQSFLRFS